MNAILDSFLSHIRAERLSPAGAVFIENLLCGGASKR
jgi:hypothetical protein